MSRACLSRAVLASTLVLAALPGSAAAMPGGAGAHASDKLWGHPLETSALPAGALTVKASGRDLMDKRQGVAARLYRVEAGKRSLVGTAKSAANGRARFDGLVAGQRYLAEIDGEAGRKPRSTVFKAPTGKGVRLLLSVYAADGEARPRHLPPRRKRAAAKSGAREPKPSAAAALPGQRSGAARIEREAGLPPTKLRLRVLAADTGKGVANAKLTLERDGKKQPLTTGADGTALVDWPPGKGPLKVELRYLQIGYSSGSLTPPKAPSAPAASRPASRAASASAKAGSASKPTSRPAAAKAAKAAKAVGLRLTFTVFRKTANTSQLELVRGTHILARAGEAGVGFLQVLALENKSRLLIDTGRPGLRIPLPEGAIAPQLGEAAKRFATISKDKRAVIITRPIPPGRLSLRVSYDLRSSGGTLDFRQQLGLKLAASVVAITNSQQVEVHGPGVSRRVVDSHGGGRPLSFFDVAAIPAGRRLELTLTNLPYRDPTPKLVLIGGALLIIIWAAFATIAAGRGRKRREAERAALIDQLAHLDLAHQRGELDDASYRDQRDPLRAKLAKNWG